MRLAGIFQNIFDLRVKLLQNKFKICVMGDSSDEKSDIVKGIMAHQIPDVFVPGKPEFKHLWNHSDLVSIIDERSWFLLQKGNLYLNVCSKEQHTYG